MLQGSLTKMEGVDALRGLSSLSARNNLIIGTIVSSYNFVISVCSIPMRLVFRKNMGERAFSPFAFIVAFIFYFFWGLFLGTFFVMLFFKHNYTINEYFMWMPIYFFVTTPYSWCLFLLAYFGINHFRRIIKKARNNDIGYSYFRGESRFYKSTFTGKKVWRFEADDSFTRMIIEPLSSLVVGAFIMITLALIIIFTSTPSKLMATHLMWWMMFGAAISFSSLCLFLEEFGIMMRLRAAVLDLVDAEKDMTFLNAKKARIDNYQKDINKEAETNQNGFTEIIYEDYEVKSEYSSVYNELKSRFLRGQ